MSIHLTDIITRLWWDGKRGIARSDGVTVELTAAPFLLPGISVQTGKGDGFPIQQGQLQRWSKGKWVPFGGLWSPKNF